MQITFGAFCKAVTLYIVADFLDYSSKRKTENFRLDNGIYIKGIAIISYMNTFIITNQKNNIFCKAHQLNTIAFFLTDFPKHRLCHFACFILK